MKISREISRNYANGFMANCTKLKKEATAVREGCSPSCVRYFSSTLAVVITPLGTVHIPVIVFARASKCNTLKAQISVLSLENPHR